MPRYRDKAIFWALILFSGIAVLYTGRSIERGDDTSDWRQLLERNSVEVREYEEEERREVERTNEPDVTITEMPRQVFTEIRGTSGTIVQHLRGNRYVNRYEPNASFFEEWIIIVTPDGNESELYHARPDRLYVGIHDVGLSPKGNFVTFTVRYYEGSATYVMRVTDKSDLYRGMNLGISKIVWSPDDSFVALVDHHSSFEGSGSNALFVSEPGDHTRLRRVFNFGPPDVNPLSEAEGIDDLYVVNGNVIFTARDAVGRTELYSFDVKRNVLTNLSSEK